MWVDRVRQGDKRDAPGFVRISLGCYSDRADLDRALTALEQIVGGDIAARYEQGCDGSYRPRDYDEPRLFDLGANRRPRTGAARA
jgi:hypothetical protein